MSHLKPSCFQPAAHDPHAPLRDPRSRRSTADCTADMASVIVEIARGTGDGKVTKDDLFRAGFTNAEIDSCQPEAVVAARALMRPRQIGRVAA